jgi:Xaa-Pro aminopeptidase
VKAPFDIAKLDRLLEEAELDVVVATSKHNVRYLLGGYSEFFAHFDAFGVDRFVPAVGYPRQRPELAFCVMSELESWQHEVEPPWVATVVDECQTSLESAEAVARLVERIGGAGGAVGIEPAFLPETMHARLAQLLPHARLVDAAPLLEELRAVKRPDELERLRVASEQIVASMRAAVHGSRPGVTTREIMEKLRREEVARGLEFEYLLAAAGPSFNRAPSDAVWESGRVLSLDSGGQKDGYLGDLARMAVLGQPDARLREALAEIGEVQEAARAALRPGATGAELYAAAEEAVARSAHRERTTFLAHGIGLVTHEAPRLTDSGPVRYPATHRDRPLEPGMVLSIETDAKIEDIGFVKIEETVAVTELGHEAYGDGALDWIVVDA